MTVRTDPAPHPVFTTSTGSGRWRVEASVARSLDSYALRTFSQPILELRGADWDVKSTGDVPLARFFTRLDGVTDFEHDPCKFALLDVALPHTAYENSEYRRIVGVISDLRVYPPGVDPLEQSDQDTAAGVCDRCQPEHRFAPYLPPERPETDTLKGWAVAIQLSLQADYAERPW